MANPTVSMTIEGGVAIFSLPTRIDVSNTRELVLPVRQGITSGHNKVVLDFEGTQAVDSTALGALVQVYKTIKAEGGELMLCGVSDAVRRVFSITRLDQVFTLCSDRADALSRISKT